MIRIIAGKYKSRQLCLPKLSKEIRPTQDKIRGAIFSSINDVSDYIVLDLFAGSGAYGFEALSRGSKYIYFNDKDKSCVQAIKKTGISLNCTQDISISNKDYLSFLKSNTNLKFNLVFLDPPYKDNVNIEIINYLIEKKMLHSSAIIVCEQESNIVSIEGFKLKEYKYSYKKVGIYRKVD